jgi:hypothetical protein
MPKVLLFTLVSFLCALVAFAPPAWGQAGVVDISCQGTESTGGGTSTYEYSLRNNAAVAVTLTLFYIGTLDLNAPNYTAWVEPAGMNHTMGTWAALGPGFSVMFTTMVKTPHTVVPPQQSLATPGGVVWYGSVVIPANGGTVTFGYNHPNASVDVEWFAEHPDAVNSSQGFSPLPIAGPITVYTQGYVHAPGTEPNPVEPTTWGRIKALYQ